MTNRSFLARFFQGAGVLLLLASLVLLVPEAFAVPTSVFGCAGKACPDGNGGFELTVCVGTCPPLPGHPCTVQWDVTESYRFCGCVPGVEPACCHTIVEDGVVGHRGDCQNCPGGGEECRIATGTGGCKYAFCES